ncbi:MAG: tetratricopeptide repeat protein [Isosphaeraceae bacterium]
MAREPRLTTPKTSQRSWPLSGIVTTLVLLVPCGGLWWLARAQRQAQALRLEATRIEAIALGQASLQDGRAEDAIRAVAEIPESSPQAAEALAIQGIAEAALGHPDRTRVFLEKSLALNPDQPMALKVLAAVEFGDNEPDRGFQLLARAATLDPADFRPWYASGATMLRLGDRYSTAVEVFREALKRQPDHAPSRIGLAEALIGTGESRESGALVDALLRENPDDPRVLRLAARRARLASDDASTIHFASEAIARDADDVEARVIRGQSLLRSGQAAEALEDARHATSLAPRDTAALALAAQAAGVLGLKKVAEVWSDMLRQQRERAERVERLRVEVEARPDDLSLRCELGRAAADAGLTSLARRCFRIALERDPDHAEAKQGLDALGAATP